MVGLLNIGSLVLGLIAWILPIITIINNKKTENKKGALLSFISMAACMISVYFQFLYNKHLVNISDWTAIMDTIGSVIVLSGILIGVTILLNGINLFSKNNTK